MKKFGEFNKVNENMSHEDIERAKAHVNEFDDISSYPRQPIKKDEIVSMYVIDEDSIIYETKSGKKYKQLIGGHGNHFHLNLREYKEK